MADTIRAASYRRVSTFRQIGGTSPETQLARAEALIRQHGWEHVADFYDPAVSGARESRPDLDRLFEMCRHALVDVVVVGNLSRLSRDLRNSLNFEHELAQLGVQVIDADNPNADEMARNFSYLQNHWFRQQVRKNTMRGVQATAEQGYWASGKPPFGWRLVKAPDHDKRKIPALNEAEAATLREAARLLVDEHVSCYEVAGRLNALRMLPRQGGRWTYNNVRRALRADYLSGTYTLRLMRDGQIQEHEIKGPEILPPDRVKQVRKVLADTARGARPRDRVYPLSGRVTGPCGHTYIGIFRNDRELRQYRCRTNMPFAKLEQRCTCPRVDAVWLEDLVWAEVASMLSDPARLLALADEYLRSRPAELHGEAKQIGTLDRQLAAKKRERTNIVLAAAATGPEAVADAIDQVSRDIAELEQLLERAREWAKRNAERAQLVRGVEELCRATRARLANPTPGCQREVLAALDVHVTVHGGVVLHRHWRPAVRITGILFGKVDDAIPCGPAPTGMRASSRPLGEHEHDRRC